MIFLAGFFSVKSITKGESAKGARSQFLDLTPMACINLAGPLVKRTPSLPPRFLSIWSRPQTGSMARIKTPWGLPSSWQAMSKKTYWRWE